VIYYRIKIKTKIEYELHRLWIYIEIHRLSCACIDWERRKPADELVWEFKNSHRVFPMSRRVHRRPPWLAPHTRQTSAECHFYYYYYYYMFWVVTIFILPIIIITRTHMWIYNINLWTNDDRTNHLTRAPYSYNPLPKVRQISVEKSRSLHT